MSGKFKALDHILKYYYQYLFLHCFHYVLTGPDNIFFYITGHVAPWYLNRQKQSYSSSHCRRLVQKLKQQKIQAKEQIIYGSKELYKDFLFCNLILLSISFACSSASLTSTLAIPFLSAVSFFLLPSPLFLVHYSESKM